MLFLNFLTLIILHYTNIPFIISGNHEIIAIKINHHIWTSNNKIFGLKIMINNIQRPSRSELIQFKIIGISDNQLIVYVVESQSLTTFFGCQQNEVFFVLKFEYLSPVCNE